MTHILGYRILGATYRERRLVDWQSAFVAYCHDDMQAETGKEAYLSAFRFGEDFREYLLTHRTTKGFGGSCWQSWLWFDVDREGDIDLATRDTRRLAAGIVDRYRLDGDDLSVWFSGSKGFHIALPLSVCGSPEPSATFHRQCRRMAEQIGERLGVKLDTAIYDRVRAFRAPNSRHPKTGLRKRYLDYDELMVLRTEAIVSLAADSSVHGPVDTVRANDQAVADWRGAAEAVKHEQRPIASVRGSLNRLTMEVIRDGTSVAVGDRHRYLYSAARNLGEFGCSLALALALLTESGLDMGLPPSDVRRQIEQGVTHGQEQGQASNQAEV